MEISDILDEAETEMQKAYEFTQSQIGKVRTGRANSSLVDDIQVDAYGSKTPLNQVAGVSTPDARTIMIQPYDPSIAGEIEKAIQSADMGFNPQNDGNVIRIPIPPLTQERREEFVKVCKNYAEEGRISIRNARRAAMDELKKSEKEKEISEDERISSEEEVQKLTDKYVALVDEVLAAKEKELIGDN